MLNDVHLQRHVATGQPPAVLEAQVHRHEKAVLDAHLLADGQIEFFFDQASHK